MATYKEIAEWIKSKNGFTVKSCWIAHVKEINDLNPRKAYNRINPSIRKVPCPCSKVKYIERAFSHFRMI